MAERIRRGMDISAATKPDGKSGELAESNMAADRDEDFNTRYGSYRGWQMAIERVKPIPRDTAQLNLSRMVLEAQLNNTAQVVDYLIRRFMRVPPADDARAEADCVPRTRTGHVRHCARPKPIWKIRCGWCCT